MRTSLGEYPYCSLDEGRPDVGVVGFPVEPNTKIDTYLKLLHEALTYLLETCGVKALVVSVGYDPLKSDEETVLPMDLYPEDYKAIGEASHDSLSKREGMILTVLLKRLNFFFLPRLRRNEQCLHFYSWKTYCQMTSPSPS